MMSKKMSLKTILLIFFVVELIIAFFFLGKTLHFGSQKDTGKKIWLEEKTETMNQEIDFDIQPDLYVKKYNVDEPWEFTYGSKWLYGKFVKMFGDGSAILNFRLWRMLLYLDIFIILAAAFIRAKSSKLPSKIQLIFEMIYGFIDDLVIETLGENRKHFTQFFFTIFLFIWLSNWTALLPIPGISEPTRNLNVPLGLGFMSIALVHFMSLKKKGIVDYVKGFCEPIFIMAPLNIVGEVSKVISISFRLFGNIFGGAIITLVVSSLTHYVIVPVGLNLFFTMFAGTIQAFVFTMLSLTYLSMEIVD
ncbi:MAG TPA: F0F1 ATP synthase subunit A [Candidatus Cloacimonadota bacterium]|nr:F0F1 ATP synthase subunit A [Candidatus Cloacimonadota bacterium]